MADVLQGLAGAFDIAPQTFVIDSYNPASNIDIPNLNFPSSDVRGAYIKYVVHRTTNTNEVNEIGTIYIIYNNTNGTWDISEDHAQDALIDFNITNTGQVQFSTDLLAGTSHAGFITFTAQSLQNP